MAGHSKWSNIKHRKGAQDAKRGQVFTKLIREITVAARNGGDIDANPRLRAAVDKGLGMNMSKDTIEKAINKGSGVGQDGVTMEEIVYEGYGPGGVAFIVACATDNKKRTVSDIRHYFSKLGGSLGQTGSVSFSFETFGLVTFHSELEYDTLLEFALESGCDDLECLDGEYLARCEQNSLYQVAQYFRDKGLKITNATIEKKPTNLVEGDQQLEETIVELFHKFQEHDDVQRVFCNYAFTNEGNE